MRINSKAVPLLCLGIAAAYYFAFYRHRSDQSTFFYVAGAWLLLPYLFGPFQIHRTQRSKLEPSYTPFDPRGAGSPPEVSRYYEAIEGDLARLGFALVRSYSTRSAATNANGFILLFQNRKTSEVLRLIAAVAEAGVIRSATALLVFSTEFADGTEVATSNSRTPRVFPIRPAPYHSFNFPTIRDADHLLAAHRSLVRRFEGGRVRLDAVGDDPDRYIAERDHRRPLAYHVECGYSYRDEAAGVQRPTWKGATLMTWKMLWPARPTGLILRKVRARRLLRELEAEGLEI